MGLLRSRHRRGDWSGAPSATTEAASDPERATEAPERRNGGAMANIGKSISINGDVTGNEDLVIDGDVKGKVELPNNQLTLGASGRIHADVSAKSVVVVGKVTGNVTGSERVEIQATGVVEGDIRSPRLVVAEGAVLNSTVQMTSGTHAGEAAATPRASAGASTLAATGSAELV